MILPVSNNLKNSNLSIGTRTKTDESVIEKEEVDTLLDNSYQTRMRINLDKFIKAFTLYPVKGLNGSKNANFYEFLTMGIVPYIVGSATLISIFNYRKPFSLSDKAAAAPLGKKMALGVLFYALFKTLSKAFIDYPVKWTTGVDTQLPYKKINHQLQEAPGSYDLTSIEYHKVGESVDFPRWDLLYGDISKGEKANEKFDKIAKKNGLGENLNDSDQEVKPLYKEILVKSSVARSFSSYLWAAVGVVFAFQRPWENYLNNFTLKFWKPKEFLYSLKLFGKSFVDSAKELVKTVPDETSHLKRHAGKYIVGLAAASSVLGVLNAVCVKNKPSKNKSNDIINDSKESVVC